jgi:hypothetical protein
MQIVEHILPPHPVPFCAASGFLSYAHELKVGIEGLKT